MEEVARALLGARLISTLDGERVEAVVVETEAYGGPDDPASHAATVSGVTERNRLMWGPAGILYVYRIYGMHWCLNVVTGREGEAQAVLLRGAEILVGEEAASRRREGRTPVAAGPGRLAQALGVDGSLNGHDLREPPLALAPGWSLDPAAVGVSGRIGIREAAEWPLRFYVRRSAGVSRPR